MRHPVFDPSYPPLQRATARPPARACTETICSYANCIRSRVSRRVAPSASLRVFSVAPSASLRAFAGDAKGHSPFQSCMEGEDTVHGSMAWRRM